MTDIAHRPVHPVPFNRRRSSIVGLAAALVGFLVLAFGLWIDARQALFSYLAAYAFGSSVALGALIFLMIGHATDATWPVAIRRLTEAIAGTIPVFFVMFLPITLGLPELYAWMHPERAHDAHYQELIGKKSAYLNAPFFVGRTIFYFVVWGLVVTLLRRWSKAQDHGASFQLSRKLKVLSSAALPLVGLCLVFAAFDWLMSLTPEWFSTMYGVYYFAGGFLGALALLTLLSARAGGQGRTLERCVGASHYYALGRLLLAFTVFWAYVAFFQFFLIYVANRPEEAEWYVVRGFGGWSTVSVALAIGHFVVPFSLLLSYRLKRHRPAVAAVAGWLLAMHYIDIYWLVLPALHARITPHVFDAAALLAVAGTATTFGAALARRANPTPFNDPRFAASLRYSSQ